jgi:amidase
MQSFARIGSGKNLKTMGLIQDYFRRALKAPESITQPVRLSETSIEEQNPRLNAICTRVDATIIEQNLRKVAQRVSAGQPVGMLAAMPYVAKDTHATLGLRTTRGSPIFANWLPTYNDEIVQRYLAADAVLIGKSNTPEFAAGSQTFNTIFGATTNPFDISKTAGGSSGGAAVALATGMTVLACGSDLAASLRNPAAFCGVIGFRPSTRANLSLRSSPNSFDTLSIAGPMATNVDDVRLSYRAIFGTVAEKAHRPIADWLSLWQQEQVTRAGQLKPLKIGYTLNGGGQFPVQKEVATQLEIGLQRLRDAGHDLIEVCPDFSGIDACFQTLRGLYFVECFGELYKTHKTQMKDTVTWNIAQGLKLNASDIAQANITRSLLSAKLQDCMQGLDAWLLPTSQVLPFSIDDPYPTSINGEALVTYIDWLKSCYWLTVTGNPAISLPCGLAQAPGNTKPLPVGLQVVGKWMQDETLLDIAERIEQVLKPIN